MGLIFDSLKLYCQTSTVKIPNPWAQNLDKSDTSSDNINLNLDSVIAHMSVEQKAGQFFLIGFSGKKITNALLDLIREINPGGVIVFGRNIGTARETAQLNSDIQKISDSKIPLFIAVDQEGGAVTRIKLWPPFPSALSIGMNSATDLSLQMGQLTGDILSALGFNMNLAPVMDISDPLQSSFIGTRSFGNDPQVVSKIAIAFAKGLDLAGVLPTAKHFPGHGNTRGDSHTQTLVKNIDLTHFKKHELIPYINLKTDIPYSAVMVSHVIFPELDMTRKPAAFSRTIVQGLLRTELNFSGLVITDDLEMSGADEIGNLESRTLSAIQAGSDLVMIAWDRNMQRLAHASVVAAIKNGTLPENDVNQALRRILKIKSQYMPNLKTKPPDLAKFREIIASHRLRNLTSELLKQNFDRSISSQMTSVKSRLLGSEFLIFSYGSGFADYFKKIKAFSRFIPLRKFSSSQLRSLLERNPNLTPIFYVTGSESAKIVNSLQKNIQQRSVVVNGSVPGLLQRPSEFLLNLDIYSNDPRVGKLLADTLVHTHVKGATTSDTPQQMEAPTH